MRPSKALTRLQVNSLPTLEFSMIDDSAIDDVKQWLRGEYPNPTMPYEQLKWEAHHHRFGLAGEGQADIIQRYLERQCGRVLNIGCGPWGKKVDNLAEYCGSLVAADKHPEAIEQARTTIARSNVSLLVADAAALPFVDCSMDYIVALGLFYGIKDPQRVFSEFRRVCSPGGYIMVTNAVAHSKERYEQLGRDAGFHVVEEAEGYCHVASGDIKRRYLLVFAAPD